MRRDGIASAFNNTDTEKAPRKNNATSPTPGVARITITTAIAAAYHATIRIARESFASTLISQEVRRANEWFPVF